jgi:hypothetical protein
MSCVVKRLVGATKTGEPRGRQDAMSPLPRRIQTYLCHPAEKATLEL